MIHYIPITPVQLSSAQVTKFLNNKRRPPYKEGESVVRCRYDLLYKRQASYYCACKDIFSGA